MSNFLFLAAAHFWGDFAFQNSWLSQEKSHSWEILIYHCLVYTSTFYLLLSLFAVPFTPLQLSLIFLTHFFIDALKSPLKLVPHIWQDQFLHLFSLFLIFPLPL